jgi:glutathione S-transferase
LLQQASSGPYFLGEEYSLADVAIAPFLLRLYCLGKFVEGEDFEFEQVKANPRLAEFVKGSTSRPSTQETYCGDAFLVEVFQKKFGLTK